MIILGVEEMRNNTLSIGGGRWNDPTLNALVDDLAIYSFAMNQDQIAMLNAGIDPLAEGASLPKPTEPSLPKPPTQTPQTITKQWYTAGLPPYRFIWQAGEACSSSPFVNAYKPKGGSGNSTRKGRTFMKINKVLCAALAVIMLSGSMSASGQQVPSSTGQTQVTAAQESDSIKTYTITESEGGTIIENPTHRMFWEYPVVPAGQSRTGKIYIKNDTDYELDLSPSSVILPFDNQQALKYLSYLHLTLINSKGQTVFDGRYTEITENGGIDFPSPAPGKTEGCYYRALQIRLHRKAEDETAPVRWEVSAKAGRRQKAPGFVVPAVIIVACRRAFRSWDSAYIFDKRRRT